MVVLSFFSVVSHPLPFPSYIECSSPTITFLAYHVPLSHHPSVTFYEILWSVLTKGHYKYCVVLYY